MLEYRIHEREPPVIYMVGRKKQHDTIYAHIYVCLHKSSFEFTLVKVATHPDQTNHVIYIYILSYHRYISYIYIYILIYCSTWNHIYNRNHIVYPSYIISEPVCTKHITHSISINIIKLHIKSQITVYYTSYSGSLPKEKPFRNSKNGLVTWSNCQFLYPFGTSTEFPELPLSRWEVDSI